MSLKKGTSLLFKRKENPTMRIIISPAKKMNKDTDTLAWQELPAFLPQTEQLCRQLQTMSYEELKRLWKCNDRIAEQNAERLKEMDLRRGLTPAILAYEGVQYQYMAPGVFTDRELAYVREHLRILSGFYGMLRPFDGVTPYRLEMQAALRVGGAKDLYEFWGSRMADSLFGETDCILNLASREYSLCISKYLTGRVRFVTCVFGEEKEGRVIEKGTRCKMARGEMVRFLAGNGIADPAEICGFTGLGYRYAPQYSDENTFVFLAEESPASNRAG